MLLPVWSATMGRDISSASPGRPSKIVRLIEEYDLDGVGDELERRWTAADGERASLRQLADTFNRRLLEHALADAGVHSLAGETENLYRLLTGDEVGAADRTRAKRRLEREGIDVECLQSDFVSYQSVRTYLTSHRDASYEADTDPVAQAESTIGRLRSRLASVAESKLEQATSDDAVGLGQFDVTVSVRVTCRECGHQAEVGPMLERGGCNCA